MFHPKTFLPTLFLPPIDFSTPTCFLWHNHHVSFWETLRPKFFGHNIFWCIDRLFSPFLVRGEKISYHKIQCVNGLFGELGICCMYHHYKIPIVGFYWSFMLYLNKPIAYCHPTFNLFVNVLTSCFQRLHLHLGQCCHCQSHINTFSFMCCFISWGGHNGDNLGKTLLPSTPNICIFPLFHKVFDCLH